MIHGMMKFIDLNAFTIQSSTQRYWIQGRRTYLCIWQVKKQFCMFILKKDNGEIKERAVQFKQSNQHGICLLIALRLIKATRLLMFPM